MLDIFSLCQDRLNVARNAEIMENIFFGWLCGDRFDSVHLNLLVDSFLYMYRLQLMCTIINCIIVQWFLDHEIHYTKSDQPSIDKDSNHWIDLIL